MLKHGASGVDAKAAKDRVDLRCCPSVESLLVLSPMGRLKGTFLQ